LQPNFCREKGCVQPSPSGDRESTPRTDAFIDNNGEPYADRALMAAYDFARQLERELRALQSSTGASQEMGSGRSLPLSPRPDSAPSSTANDLPRIDAALQITAWAEIKPDLLAHDPNSKIGSPHNISFQLRELRGLLKKAVGLQ